MIFIQDYRRQVRISMVKVLCGDLFSVTLIFYDFINIESRSRVAGRSIKALVESVSYVNIAYNVLSLLDRPVLKRKYKTGSKTDLCGTSVLTQLLICVLNGLHYKEMTVNNISLHMSPVWPDIHQIVVNLYKGDLKNDLSSVALLLQ